MRIRCDNTTSGFLAATTVFVLGGCSGSTGEHHHARMPPPIAESPMEIPSLPPPEGPSLPDIDEHSRPLPKPHSIRYDELFRFDDLVRRLYEERREDYDRLGAELDGDEMYMAISCNPAWIEGLEPGKQVEDFLSGEKLAVYGPLCKATQKIRAERTARGTRFLVRGYEFNPSYVVVYLDRRRNATDLYSICDVSSFDQDRGSCDVVIDAKWSVTYRWEPFCRPYMAGEQGC